jgi:anti-sigma factor RsiW
MCDAEAKLVAWLDQELPAAVASAMERHVAGCEECRCSVARYREVSDTLDAYCDAVMARNAPPRVASWLPVWAGALAAAAVIFLAIARTRVAAPQVHEPAVAIASAPPSKPIVAEPASRKTVAHTRRSTPHPPRALAYAAPRQPMDTAIQIAIPAEAMFPPGALPNGVHFIADLRIDPDGSVKQVRLRQ